MKFFYNQIITFIRYLTQYFWKEEIQANRTLVCLRVQSENDAVLELDKDTLNIIYSAFACSIVNQVNFSELVFTLNPAAGNKPGELLCINVFKTTEEPPKKKCARLEKELLAVTNILRELNSKNLK